MLYNSLTLKELSLLVLFIESGFIIGVFGMALANRTADTTVRNARWLKMGTYFIITHLMILLITIGDTILICTMILILSICFYEFINAGFKSATLHKGPFIFGLVLLTMVTTATIFLSVHYTFRTILFVYLIIAVLDSYSQITGQLFGKHTLAPKISPSKTIEGAIGGTLAALLTAFVFRSFTGLSPVNSIITGLFLSCSGITGDLVASRYKRYFRIKDYSTLLPGQGGFIDRFNSFLAGITVFTIIELII
jgi:phosphatidate cytidylyltransferase